jgi:DNA-binding Lrp family transcriptional regulator
MFETEADLVSTIIANRSYLLSLANWKDDSNTTILGELNLGYGIADLVIAKNTTLPKNRIEPLTYDDIALFKLLEKSDRLPISEIMEITRSSKKKTKSSLEKLMQEQYISHYNGYYKANKIENQRVESIAIEAKLKNWKRALMQAYRYKWFASYSYVVMDSKHVNPAKNNKDLFRKYNVGLAAMSKEGYLTILLKPKKTKPLDGIMNKLLGEHLHFRSEKG